MMIFHIPTTIIRTGHLQRLKHWLGWEWVGDQPHVLSFLQKEEVEIKYGPHEKIRTTKTTKYSFVAFPDVPEEIFFE